MHSKKEEIIEALIARECGTATPERLTCLEAELAGTLEFAQLEQEFIRMLVDLRQLVASVPESLDHAVNNVILRGVPEDCYGAILEVLNELGDDGGLRQQQPGQAIYEHPWAQKAASLTGAVGSDTAEQILREQFSHIEQRETAEGYRVLVGTPYPSRWVGIVVSSDSVPLAGIVVGWTTAEGRSGEVRTDRRGTFTLRTEGYTLKSVTIGPPVALTVTL